MASARGSSGGTDRPSAPDGSTARSLLALRAQLFDGDRVAPGTAAARDRDRAAHMLLYLDTPSAVLDLGLEHILHVLGSPRGDAGILVPRAGEYRPTVVRADDATDVDQITETPLPTSHPVIQTACLSPRPTAFERVTGNRQLGSLEPVFSGLGSTAMLATRIEAEDTLLGLLCVDETDGVRSWRPADVAWLDGFVARWLGPILLASLARSAERTRVAVSEAERAAVALLAEGLTYTEIARRLGKSVHTIDNQLRSARRKTGARNAIELVSFVGPAPPVGSNAG